VFLQPTGFPDEILFDAHIQKMIIRSSTPAGKNRKRVSEDTPADSPAIVVTVSSQTLISETICFWHSRHPAF